MKLFLSIFITIIFLQNSFGQNELKDSEIFLKNETSLSGNVQFLDSNPFEILLNNQRPININELDSLKNSVYKLRNINIDGNERLIVSLVEGDRLSLYRDRIIKLFYIKKGEKFYELKGGKTLIEEETRSYFIKNNQYKGLLKYLLSDKLELHKEIDNLEYNEKEFKSFVVKLNDKIEYIKTETKNYFSDKEIFFKYSYLGNNIYYQPDPNMTPSFYELGIRMYLKEGSRSSIGTSIQHGQIRWRQGDYFEITQLNLNYMNDFYKTRYFNLYLNFRFLDVTYLLDKQNGNSLNIYPRFNVDFGYRYYISNKINMFVELNQLNHIRRIGNNLSIGFSYNL